MIKRWLAVLVVLLMVSPAAAQTTLPSVMILQGDVLVNGAGQQMPVLGFSIIGLTISVTGGPSFTVNFEGATAGVPAASVPASSFKAVQCTPMAGGSNAASTTTAGNWQCSIAGLSYFQARLSGVGGTGSIRVVAAALGGAISSVGTGSGGGGGGSGSSSTFGVAFPSTGTAAGFKDSAGVNMAAGNLDATGALVVHDAQPITLGGSLPAGSNSIGATRTQDGSGTGITSATRGSQQALTVQIVDGSGTQVTSFGGAGGTSSNFGSAFPTPGTPAGFKDGSGNMQPITLGADNATNATLKVPVLGATANAAAPSWTEAHEAPLSVDLAGNLRTIGTATISGSASDNSSNATTKLPVIAARANAAVPSWTEGNQVPISTDLAGSVRTINMNGSTVDGSSNAIVVGNVASAAADSGSPVKVGGVVATALPTAGANANRFNLMTDKFGRAITAPQCDRALCTDGALITLTSTTETTLLAAGGSGVFLDITYLKCTNTSATLVRVDLRDATAGTVVDSWALGASGGGVSIPFVVPWKQTTANNNWTVQLSGSVTDVRCRAQAAQNK